MIEFISLSPALSLSMATFFSLFCKQHANLLCFVVALFGFFWFKSNVWVALFVLGIAMSFVSALYRNESVRYYASMNVGATSRSSSSQTARNVVTSHPGVVRTVKSD